MTLGMVRCIMGLRVDIDMRAEKIGYKIREARLERLPYLAIIGQEEEEKNCVSVRSREKGDEGSIDLETFAKRLVEENASKYIYHQHMTEEESE